MEPRVIVAHAERIGFLPAYSFLRRMITGCQVAILTYHRVSSLESGFLLPPMPTDLFERQIEYLQENFQIVSLDKLSELLRASRKLPKKAVAITFDDGYKDNFVHAYPILKKYNALATFFLPTGYISTRRLFWWDLVNYCIMSSSANKIVVRGVGAFLLNSETNKVKTGIQIRKILKRMPEQEKSAAVKDLLRATGVDVPDDLGKDVILSWSEIKEMAREGMAFGAHTVNHYVLTKVPKGLCHDEIFQSKKDIEEMLGTSTSFSYPNGACNIEIMSMVRKAGFTCAVKEHPYGLVGKRSNVFALRRIGASNDFLAFKGMLSGIIGDFAPFYSR